MASNNPFGFHVAPFCWRVGTPLLAKALPFDVERSFFIISFLSVWMTGVVVFYLARRFALSRWAALSGMLLFFTLGYAARANLYNLWKPDPLAFLVITLAIYCIASRKDWQYALLLAVGVAVKESVLFVVPLYYTLNAEKPLDHRLALRTLLLALPSALVFIALRSFIPMRNEDIAYIGSLPVTLTQVQLGSSTYDLGRLWNEIGVPRLQSVSVDALLGYTVGTFGVVAATLPLFSVRRNISIFIRFLPFLLLVFAQVLFATNVERLLVFGFPAIIIMGLTGAEAVAKTLRVKDWTLSIVLGGLIVVSLTRMWPFIVPPSYEALLFLIYLAGCFSWRVARES
jgi:hypothetical protein